MIKYEFDSKNFNGLSAVDFVPVGLQGSGPQAQMRQAHTQRRAIVIRGLPGVGKTTLANAVCEQIRDNSHHLVQPFHINADVMRKTLCADLGFSDDARVMNAGRIGMLARMAQLNGLVPVIDFVMPVEACYNAFAAFFESDNFKVYSLSPGPLFHCRFKDTVELYEDGTGWKNHYDPDSKKGNVYDVMHYKPDQIELIATSIYLDSRS